ncbi:low molecular weight phosphatase family protein [Candidatus Parcubacteria bacterium]|nr:MAG: low molecular weight phosphatase family protein [Candidatus Parcubacteria bacterium]
MAKAILCVCMGNTCRSPMVEALVRQGLAERGIEAQVESCGLLDELLEGKFTTANEHSIEMMSHEGIDISGHEPRHVSVVGDIGSFDAIIAVTDSVKSTLIELGADGERIVVLNGANGGVPDPYEKGRDAYVQCIATIKGALPDVIAVL